MSANLFSQRITDRLAVVRGFGAWSRDGVIAHSPVG